MANNFQLTLDTFAPSGSITAERYYKENGVVNITHEGGAAFMKVWFDTNATSDKTSDGYKNATWEAPATTHSTGFSKDGDFYFHLVLMDDVGNESNVIHSTITTYDKQLPVVSDVSLNDGATYTKDKKLTLTFRAVDPDASSSPLVSGSGIASGEITSADIAGSPVALNPTPEEITAGEFTRDITIKDGIEEQVITVSVTVTDKAGNTSVAVSDSIHYDSTPAQATFTLRNSDDTANLPEWVNTTAFMGVIDIIGESDVVGYKMWEGSASDEPGAYTPVETTEDPIKVSSNFSTGDAPKTINAKIKDKAGNETTLTAQTVKLDMTAPTASIARDQAYISNITGHTTTVITNTVDMINTAAGGKSECYSPMAAYTLYIDNEAAKTGTDNLPATFSLTSADFGSTAGENKWHQIKLNVKDQAGNEVTSSEIEVYVDTAAPTSTGFSGIQPYYNATSGFTISAEDAGAGVGTMTAWVSSIADDTTAQGSAIPYHANPIVTEVNWTNVVQGTNYAHIKYVDNVGNVSYFHSVSFIYDDVAPADGTIKFTRPAYHSTNAQVNINSSDATSGLDKMKLWGDIAATASSATGITEEEAEWETYNTSKGVFLTTGAGDKTVYILFKDKAGNVSKVAASDITELDPNQPDANLEIWYADEHATVVDTNERPIVAHLWGTDDHGQPVSDTDIYYLLVNDYNTNQAAAEAGTSIVLTPYEVRQAYAVGTILHNSADPGAPADGYVKVKTAISAEDNTSWEAIKSKVENPFTKVQYESGKTYMKVDGLYIAGDEGTKTQTLYISDNAGNVTSATFGPYKFDPTPPEVDIIDVDYNKISKVHTLRRNASGEIPEKFNDETHFTLHPDSEIIAYKNCAYADKATALAGSHTDTSIPTTGGSLNMISPDVYRSAADVLCMVRGADYQNAVKSTMREFSADVTYIKGEFVKHSSKFYEVTAAAGHTGAWVDADFTEVPEVNGAHYIVAYVQDTAKNWSSAAVFKVKV